MYVAVSFAFLNGISKTLLSSDALNYNPQVFQLTN